MAHFAEIDENNIVTRVLVTDNEYPNEGYDWLVQTFGGTWIQTSYNARIRKNFAGIGFTYDEALDAFIAPKPFESWVLDEETCLWKAPKPLPANAISQDNPDGTPYRWDEDTLNWVEDIGE